MKHYPNSKIDYTKYLEPKPKTRRSKGHNDTNTSWHYAFGSGLLKDIPKKHKDRS